MINSEFLDGLEIEAAKKTVIDNLKNKNQADYSITVSYTHLRAHET